MDSNKKDSLFVIIFCTSTRENHVLGLAAVLRRRCALVCTLETTASAATVVEADAGLGLDIMLVLESKRKDNSDSLLAAEAGMSILVSPCASR